MLFNLATLCCILLSCTVQYSLSSIFHTVNLSCKMLNAIELVILEMVLLALGCLLLIRYYKGHMVTADVTLTVYVSWVMGFIGVLLLPYDLSVALIDE